MTQPLTSLQRHWILSGNIPNRFIGMTPADVTERIGKFSPVIDSWITDVLDGKVVKTLGGIGKTGVGLLFDGGPGLGKTTHAVVTLLELIRRLPASPDEARKALGYSAVDFSRASRPVYYMTFPDFLNRKKSMFDAEPDQKRELQLEMDGFHGRAVSDHLNVRVLVLDDLGKEYGSEYNVAGFDEILRSRYDKALPTIVTTNTPREQWKNKYGDAMGSFVHEAFKRVIIGTTDLRRNG
jgi:DNA replication protein DnaC